MDLLYLHVMGIPNTESLCAVYIVDGDLCYASTVVCDTYKLYKVINHTLSDFISSTESLGSLDTVVGNRLSHVWEQSGRHENGIRVVSYKTDKLKEKNIKKTHSERTEISRFVSTRRKKLF